MAQRRTAMASDPGDMQARRSGNRGRNRGRNRQPAASIKRDITNEPAWRRNPQRRQDEELRTDAGFLINQGMDLAQGFNPYNPYARAPEQGYVKALEQAQASVMDQFNRTMEPQFARQAQDFQQQMMAQGIDPNSDAYKIRFQEMQKSQNDARQTAMSQAYQLGMENQAQGHTQFMQGLQYPLQAAQTYMPMYQVPQQQQFAARQAEIERKAQQRNIATQGQYSLRAAQAGAQATRDAAAMQMMGQYGQGGQQSINPLSAAVGGFAQGAGAGMTGYFLR